VAAGWRALAATKACGAVAVGFTVFKKMKLGKRGGIKSLGCVRVPTFASRVKAINSLL
jgi:hypothetical protein